MKGRKLLSVVALLVMTAIIPIPAFAADSGVATSSANPPVTSSQGLFVSGDVVLSGICQVEGQYEAGQMMVFRAQVLKSDGSDINPSTTDVTVNLANGTQVKMQYTKEENFWVGVFVIPPNTPLGPLPYTITAQDQSGNKGTFVPLGIPPMIVGNTITVTVDGKTVATIPKSDASVSLYSIIQILKSQGLHTIWDGRVLTLTVPGVAASSLPDLGGSGYYSIVVNGKTVMKLTGHVQKDPRNVDTTYVSTSIFDLLAGMSGGTFDGNTFNIQSKAASDSK